MIKRLFISGLVLFTGILSLQAQQETVVDNHGHTLEVAIPDAGKVTTDLGEITYTDDKFYHSAGFSPYTTIDESSDNAFETMMENGNIGRRLSQLSSQINMAYNAEVQQYINRYTRAGRQSTGYLLSRAEYYNPFFEQALRQYGLPMELKYLPVIESGLDPNATSRVGAAGLWQFMTTTGRQYNLRIDSYIDERRDPEKSSLAAARYLNDLYKCFGDWTLALAAYNCGPTRVSNAIRQAGGGADFWSVYRFLPRETRGYVPAFIAASYIMNYYNEYNIMPASTGLPDRCSRVELDRDISFERLASIIETDVETLKMLNPQYRQGMIKTTDGIAELRLSREDAQRFNQNKSRLYDNSESQDSTVATSVASVITAHDPSTAAHYRVLSHQANTNLMR